MPALDAFFSGHLSQITRCSLLKGCFSNQVYLPALERAILLVSIWHLPILALAKTGIRDRILLSNCRDPASSIAARNWIRSDNATISIGCSRKKHDCAIRQRNHKIRGLSVSIPAGSECSRITVFTQIFRTQSRWRKSRNSPASRGLRFFIFSGKEFPLSSLRLRDRPLSVT